MSENGRTTGAVQRFVRNYIWALRVPALFLLVPVVAFAFTVVVILPVFLGLYLELGLLPYEFLQQDVGDKLPRFYWEATAVWVFLGLPAIYSLLKTVGGEDE